MFLHPLITCINVTSTLKLLGEECRVDIITSSQACLSQCKPYFYCPFQIFHSKLPYTHYRIHSRHS